MVYVSNSALPPWSAVTLERDLVDALAERPAPRESRVSFRSFDEPSRAALAGTYDAGSLGKVTLTWEEEGPRVRAGDGLELDAFPVGDGVLYVPGSDWWLGFDQGVSAPALRIRSVFVDAVAPRRPA